VTPGLGIRDSRKRQLWPACGSPQTGTGADGSVTYRLAPTLNTTGFSVTVTPPAGSGFVAFSLTRITLDQDRTITVVLPLVDNDDPDIDGIPTDTPDNCPGSQFTKLRSGLPETLPAVEDKERSVLRLGGDRGDLLTLASDTLDGSCPLVATLRGC